MKASPTAPQRLCFSLECLRVLAAGNEEAIALIAPALTVTIATGDKGVRTHLSAQAQHTGRDGSQNTKVLNEILDKATDHLNLFRT